MKYLLLMHAREGVWPPEEHASAIAESVAICNELQVNGQYLLAAPLQAAATATCVSVRQGKLVVTEGPYMETKEQVGGFFLIEVDTLEDAVAIAARLPGTRRGTAEIRPLMAVAGLPVSKP